MDQIQFHVVQKLAPGGIECLALGLAEKSEGTVGLISLGGTVDELVAHWQALLPVKTNIQGFAKSAGLRPGLLFSLYHHFKKSRPKAVITHHIGPLLYAGIAARMAGVPIIAHIEHDAWHYKDQRRRQLGKALINLVRPRLAAVSNTVANGINECVGFSPKVIANGVDVQKFVPADKLEARQRLKLPLDKKIIGCAGRLELVKGFDQLIELMSYLNDDVIIAIYGIGSQSEALHQQAHRLGLSKRIIFAGLSNQMDKVYPAFDVFALPSRFEGLPLAALEAQACGIPVAGFDVGGVSEALCPATSELVQAGNTAFMAAAISHLIDFPPEISPRDFIKKHYSFEETLRAYAQFTEV